MPTYQYACTACEEHLEAVQRFTDEPLTECPACGGRLRKLFSAVGVVFKGSGFYRTDSRTSSNGNKAAKPDAAAAGAASTSAEGGGSTAPATSSKGTAESGKTGKATTGAGTAA